MKRRKSKKIDKIHSPVDFQKRIEIWHDMEKGKQPKPDAPEPLEPSELTRIQKIQLIEYLKYSEALSNVEISDFLKIHRITVAKRLVDIDEQFTMGLENKGFTVWQIIAKLKRTCSYVKKLARLKGDGDLYLKAELAFINECQKLGVVYEKPLAVDVFTYPVHSVEDERTLIRYYQDEQRRTATLLKTREEEAKAEGVELVPAAKEG